MRRIKNGDWVKVHYTCSLENGETVSSSEGLPPVEIPIGSTLSRDEFSRELIGMTVNEEKEFTLPPDESLGYPNDQGKIAEIPLSRFKGEVEPNAGTVMFFNFKCGPRLPGTVIEVKEDSIIVDFSHPLARKKIKYKVKILKINDNRTGKFFVGPRDEAS